MKPVISKPSSRCKIFTIWAVLICALSNWPFSSAAQSNSDSQLKLSLKDDYAFFDRAMFLARQSLSADIPTEDEMKKKAAAKGMGVSIFRTYADQDWTEDDKGQSHHIVKKHWGIWGTREIPYDYKVIQYIQDGELKGMRVSIEYRNHDDNSTHRFRQILEADLNRDLSLRRAAHRSYDSDNVLEARHLIGTDGRIIKTVPSNKPVLPLTTIYADPACRKDRTLEEILQAAARKDRATVAVIDTGIDYNHPDLAYKIPRGYSTSQAFLEKQRELKSRISNLKYDDETRRLLDELKKESIGWDFIDNDPLPYDLEFKVEDEFGFDNFYHGTGVAGVLLEGTDDIQILPVRDFANDGEEAFKYAYHRGARVINLSQAYYFHFENLNIEKVLRAYPDVLFVVAAGNDFHQDLDDNPIYPASYQLPNVLVVTSVSKEGKLSKFANIGKETVHIAAVGENVLTCKPGGGREECLGTSYAAPQVAKGAALMQRANPKLTPSDIIRIIGETSDKTDELKSVIKYGGILNQTKAIQAAKKLLK